ncbi:hypothetical protein ACHAWF_012489 [Thalassiosira exigua]
MVPSTSKQYLLIALAAALRSAKGGDDCSDLEYCGGAHGDAGQEISCTPFPVKSKRKPPYQWESYCDDDDVPKYAGSATGAKAWRQGNDDNYWVFHGCDGAGLMDDCMGGSTYAEQFGGWSNEQIPLTEHYCDGDWASHCSNPFVHPGTGRVYSWYNAGQWTYGGGNWPDKDVGKPWWDNMELPDTSQLGNGPGTAFVVLYPWVCNWDNDLGWLWGNLRPYGDKTYTTKCYYDNEPWDNDHLHGTTIPPIWWAYKFYHDDSTGKLTGWMLAQKKMDSPKPILYFESGESPTFELDGFWSPPWAAAAKVEVE